ncbi:MAG: hypothetical protein A2504_11565 [Bdellovibrionales bacterium RIFOXYD12_FULL_39_22]|nr:MAG: hypothetical protein A2385_16080 [Bdellovibrionales bacterium RIFOXYB1_FULL_39_21]OFZ44524.1 MAG: hypothetical protein A2485_06815 [Bdellovibrionales bacterium RIFOXYC12_FULL_39_17]OFZ49834.1 MAG: hypothetical protein A2404_00650 [Bdellovibrionales bacterium RIFOXYC1_FULL_39_130]OFZ71589.1 MAG: hypothetical protein A2451_01710 [Bdellovibrionales bacterium RIFOXYC2_FULL_39_8]OFZ76839.1 MAG: hypothetical protein A2560_05450 [Bdellovibrionales bacterium RIFOXYD1_FULL_39_84]OFZ95766.1 MAG:
MTSATTNNIPWPSREEKQKREAKAFVGRYLRELKAKKNILLLGLGQGYHLAELVEVMAQFHGNDFKLCVVELHKELFDNFSDEKTKNSKNISWFIAHTADDFFSQQETIDFLIGRPAILLYPESFHQDTNYYQGILTYQASDKLDNIVSKSKSPIVKKYLSSFLGQVDFAKNLSSHIKRKEEFGSMDFLFYALHEMTGIDTQITEELP